MDELVDEIVPRPGESYAHALAVVRLAAETRLGKDRAAQDFADGRRVAVPLPDDVAGSDMSAGGYLMEMELLICAEVHDQTVCCAVHGHHLHRRVRYSPDGSSCPVCRAEP